ncbi:MAG: hypothetical protein IT336_13105 [Thermomicrobiales bacterium]|nr:hypothetical protein [Thermomicrobiales bacterium]
MQQTPVRFYITQNDDQPIVRTIPVTTHPIPQAPKPAQAQAASAQGNETKSRVAKLVRSAVKRSDSAR